MSDMTNSIYLVVIFFQEKDRDGCPKIVNLGSAKTDLFYERNEKYLQVLNAQRKAELELFTVPQCFT